MCICVCMYERERAYVCLRRSGRLYVRFSVCMCLRLHERVRLRVMCGCVCLFACVYMFARACSFVLVCVCVLFWFLPDYLSINLFLCFLFFILIFSFPFSCWFRFFPFPSSWSFMSLLYCNPCTFAILVVTHFIIIFRAAQHMLISVFS